MFIGIQGKKALITGAGRGLGKAIAQFLAAQGATIIAASRTPEHLSSLIEEIGGEEKGHFAIPVDFAEMDASQKILDTLKAKNVHPDIIVHNVGGNLNITDPLCSIEDWRSVMRINVEIPIELNRVLIPSMQKNGWGRVCHISSISALENQGPPSYCAAKAALIAYTRSMGRFVSPQGVIVTSVLPGPVKMEGGYWDIASKERPEHVKKFLTERMAIQRFGQPEEISHLVGFLCSDMSSFCVGSAFLVDGGQGRVFYAQE